MSKLTKAQRHHLTALAGANERGRSAYPGLRIPTLEALVRRRLATSFQGPGSGFMPHTNIIWAITPAGRLALKEPS